MLDNLNDVYGVILAGGSGTRFWPKSKHRTPKQLCAIGDATESMIEITLGRLEGFIPAERRVIVTHKDQVESTKKIVGDRCHTVIAEPEARNTAAALALAALEIKNKHPQSNPMMISLHADHVIRDVMEFKKVIKNALSVARNGFLTLLGIVPQYPETGYGYIEKGDLIDGSDCGYHVTSFREKPDLATATKYVESKKFHWNSGLFVWSVDTFLEELQIYLPHTKEVLTKALNENPNGFSKMETSVLASYYAQIEKIAIDNAVLERSTKVAVVDADFGWQDVGSWSALDLCFETNEEGNLIFGDVLTIDTKNSTIDTDASFIATVGVENLIVVSAKNSILVCSKDRAQDVKEIVEYLKRNGRDDQL